MAGLEDMTKEELLEVLKIKDSIIKELREELALYEEIARNIMAEGRPGCGGLRPGGGETDGGC